MDTSLKVFSRRPYHRTLLGEIKRALWIVRKKRRVRRTDRRVKSLYEDLYTLTNKEWEQKAQAGRHEFVLGQELLTVNELWISEYYAQLVSLWIRILGGQKVLEVGSGRGSILFELLGQNPVLELTGLELSAQGILRSTEKQKEIGSSITFIEGDARTLPFPDSSFDIAVTVHVLESMPRDYEKAVAEMARVAEYAIFIEEFREAQSIADLAWLRFKDRFRDSYKLPHVEPLYFTKDIPHKEKYSMGLCVGKFK